MRHLDGEREKQRREERTCVFGGKEGGGSWGWGAGAGLQAFRCQGKWGKGTVYAIT